MNYKVLYRKYRPDSFESLIGQNHVVTILKNSIKDNRIAHAYLFSGPRGTGKTSTARILAKSINCLNNENGLACNKCQNCLSFDNNPDIIEIDAASNNGVDEIRELINNVKIMPTSLKYKVYIIDEVHMLSQSAFNALLLTLEEPPEHVIFVLATTNLESVPITIVSRCQRFDFRRIDDEEIFSHLKEVCDNEKIKYEPDGIKEIVSLSDGGMRDALSILDQLSKNSDVITSDLVSKEIGSVSDEKLLSILKYLGESNIEKFDEMFLELQRTNLNYKVVIKKLVYLLSKIASDALRGNNTYGLSFDVCKNLVMELNDLLNKININVDPYLLIKMLFYNYFDKRSKAQELKNDNELKKVEEIIDKKEIKEESEEIAKPEQASENKPKIKNEKLTNNFMEVRINNCFVNASKKYLNELKEKWNNFVAEEDNALIKGLISDTEVVTASDAYAVIMTTIPHKDKEINSSISKIEEAFFKKTKAEYKLVFIDEKEWKKEKEKYIKNLKENYQYKLIEEKQNNNLDNENEFNMSSVADVFDIEKIEVE